MMRPVLARYLNYRVVTRRAGLLRPPKVIEVRRENSAGLLNNGHSLRNDEESHAR